MKIAILFSGLIRGNYEKHTNRIQRYFEFDTFFSTWSGSRDEFFNRKESSKILEYDEPELKYNPAIDCIEPPETYRKFINNGQSRNPIWKHRTKQILAHALLYDSILPFYDIIIRARYDTIIDTTRSKDEILSLISEAHREQKAIGFYVPKGQNNKSLRGLLRHHEDHHRRKEHLVDHLIIHPAKLFDTKRVWKMHNEKRLCVAEAGWWQVLSEPYGSNHESFLGFAGVDKN